MRGSEPQDALGLLDRAVASVCGIDVEPLDEPGLTARLDRLHRAQARLAAERARLVAVLEQRRTATIDDPRHRERERQQLRRDLASRSNRAPAQAKLDAQAGQAAAEHTATGRAFADGRIDAEHVRLIAEALDGLVDRGERHQVEQDLLEVARRARPSVLGRHVRDLLARQVPVSVTLREERQQRERRFSATDTPDGGLVLSGLLYGTAAETARTALQAFRRPDGRGEMRTPGQRGADAFEQLCATALKAGAAPARHGIRPQVIVTVTTDQIEHAEDGVARLASGEPTTLGRLRHLLDDCAWSRVVLAPDGTPIEASEGVRTVPAGLWRALLARDGGCTWDGCDAPAAWCDVAHGQEPFAAGGRLSASNAALLCRRHHRRFDHGGYRIRIDGDRVRYHRHRQDVTAGAAATDDPDRRSVGRSGARTAGGTDGGGNRGASGGGSPGGSGGGTDGGGSRGGSGGGSRGGTGPPGARRPGQPRIGSPAGKRPPAVSNGGDRRIAPRAGPPEVAQQPRLLDHPGP